MAFSERQYKILTEIKSRELLQSYGVEQNRYLVATGVEAAIEGAENLGFPVVMKVVSSKIVHKSDFGGVRVGLNNVKEIRTAYADIFRNAAERGIAPEEIDGVTIQEMVEGVTEFFVGIKRDPIFGPVILAGIGGIWVELMKDIAMRITPLEEDDISKMLRELKGFPLLEGYRGRKKADVSALIKFIKKVSDLSLDNPQIVELDLNPVIVKEMGKGVICVDARIVIQENK